jgi:undecaprenyl diphosphate synthase
MSKSAIGLPDVDLIIRTSGECRISNFLLWQCARTKIWTTSILWSDFKEENLWEAISYYSSEG